MCFRWRDDSAPLALSCVLESLWLATLAAALTRHPAALLVLISLVLVAAGAAVARGYRFRHLGRIGAQAMAVAVAWAAAGLLYWAWAPRGADIYVLFGHGVGWLVFASLAVVRGLSVGRSRRHAGRADAPCGARPGTGVPRAPGGRRGRPAAAVGRPPRGRRRAAGGAHPGRRQASGRAGHQRPCAGPLGLVLGGRPSCFWSASCSSRPPLWPARCAPTSSLWPFRSLLLGLRYVLEAAGLVIGYVAGSIIRAVVWLWHLLGLHRHRMPLSEPTAQPTLSAVADTHEDVQASRRGRARRRRRRGHRGRAPDGGDGRHGGRAPLPAPACGGAGRGAPVTREHGRRRTRGRRPRPRRAAQARAPARDEAAGPGARSAPRVPLLERALARGGRERPPGTTARAFLAGLSPATAETAVALAGLYDRARYSRQGVTRTTWNASAASCRRFLEQLGPPAG